jgi:hypothetical protein
MRSVVVLAVVTAACAASEPPTTHVAHRAVGGPVEVAWQASSTGSGDDGEEIIGITLALGGRVVARDKLCCAGVMADQCRARADGSTVAYFACADALTRWEATLVSGAIVVTRIDTFIESPQLDRRTELARVPTTARWLVLVAHVRDASGR